MPYPHPLPSSRQYPDPQHFRDLERLGEEITQLAAHIHAATFQLLELICRALEAAMDQMFLETEDESADVSAETWFPSRQAIAVAAWTLLPKPCPQAGLGRKWTTAWLSRCYRAASK